MLRTFCLLHVYVPFSLVPRGQLTQLKSFKVMSQVQPPADISLSGNLLISWSPVQLTSSRTPEEVPIYLYHVFTGRIAAIAQNSFSGIIWHFIEQAADADGNDSAQ